MISGICHGFQQARLHTAGLRSGDIWRPLRLLFTGDILREGCVGLFGFQPHHGRILRTAGQFCTSVLQFRLRGRNRRLLCCRGRRSGYRRKVCSEFGFTPLPIKRQPFPISHLNPNGGFGWGMEYRGAPGCIPRTMLSLSKHYWHQQFSRLFEFCRKRRSPSVYRLTPGGRGTIRTRRIHWLTARIYSLHGKCQKSNGHCKAFSCLAAKLLVGNRTDRNKLHCCYGNGILLTICYQLNRKRFT